MKKKIPSAIFMILMCASLVKAQAAEVSVALNEQFFDALLDAIFKNFNTPEFPLAKKDFQVEKPELAFNNRNLKPFVFRSKFTHFNFQSDASSGGFRSATKTKTKCNESVRLLRESDGVRTAVRFRDGKIYAPIAFSGSYNPPLVGCIDFQGWAETNIDLEYDRQNRKLVGRLRVLNVNLGGITNLASGVLSRLVQSSIDRKINPIEILQIDKLSFVVPVQNVNGALKMKATGVRHEINNGVLNVHIGYEFSKSN
jgi:hypothetical protein